MPGLKALTGRSVTDLWKEVKNPETFWDELHDEVTDAVHDFLESALEEELLEQLQAAWYQRNPDRVDSRNGAYTRSLATRLGLIQNLRVPRSRHNTYHSQILPHYKRYEPAVEDMVQEAFVAGVSTRRVGSVLDPMVGESVSAATVSRITKRLDAAVAAFHERPLSDDAVYLFLDGVYVRVKGTDKVQRKPVLVAYVITTAGEKQLQGYRVCRSESEPEWEAFLNDLYRHGMEGKALKMVITDGNPGLHKALQTVYPYVPRQRCWVHKMRNVRAKVPMKLRDECIGELRTVYMAATQTAARARYDIWVQRWEDRASGAVECVRKDIDELLTFLSQPAPMWQTLRTTNAIERVFREVRRRTRPMTCFNNTPSCDRIIYAVFCYENTKWTGHPIPHFTQKT
jgi:transposase-like protein